MRYYKIMCIHYFNYKLIYKIINQSICISGSSISSFIAETKQTKTKQFATIIVDCSSLASVQGDTRNGPTEQVLRLATRDSI